MKKLLLFGILLNMVLVLNAQTTALDFETADCDGVNHHLFAELESGKVCILEFVMMGCQPCVIAGNGLKNIHAQFEASNPGKVHLYSMGFQNNISCTQMSNWKTANNFDHPVFKGDANQVNYYGGMGMPTVVVLGGLSGHKIYYQNQGYSSSENAPIAAAINLAISESPVVSGTGELQNDEHFTVFPNPFDNTLTIAIKEMSVTHITLSDIAGREIMRQDVPAGTGNSNLELLTGSIQPGFYVVALYNGDQQTGLQKLVKD